MNMVISRLSDLRYRLPVFSQLMLAWFAFGGLSALFFLTALFSTPQNGATSHAFQVEDEVETLAPPSETDSTTAAASRPGQRAIAITQTASDAAFSQLPTIVSLQPGETAPPPSSDEIIIRIDGAPAQTLSELQNDAPEDVSPRIKPIRNETPINKPNADLMRATKHGPAPAVSKSGHRPSQYYAKPLLTAGADTPQLPQVAIIVGGLGLDADITQEAIDRLPPSVTLGFAPYAKDLTQWTNKARQAGHEYVLELPMQARRGKQNLGPAALKTHHQSAEIIERLDWLMSRMQGYFAVTNYLGDKFSADAKAMKPVLDHIGQAGLAYIDDTGAAQKAGANQRDVASIDRILRADQTSEAISEALNGLGALAKRDGNALAKTYASSAMIDAVSAWADGLDPEEGPSLAPASAVLRARAGGL